MIEYQEKCAFIIIDDYLINNIGVHHCFSAYTSVTLVGSLLWVLKYGLLLPSGLRTMGFLMRHIDPNCVDSVSDGGDFFPLRKGKSTCNYGGLGWQFLG